MSVKVKIKRKEKEYIPEKEITSFEEEKAKEEKKGGVLAPTLAAAGIGSIMYGKNKLNKASKQESLLPKLKDDVRKINQRGVQEVKDLENSYLGLGKYFRKNKIEKTKERTAKETETAMRRVRKMARSSNWNKTKGKALIGLGLGSAAYGIYRLGKDNN